MKGCGKEVPAGYDRIDGYELHDTCGFMDFLCQECSLNIDSRSSNSEVNKNG